MKTPDQNQHLLAILLAGILTDKHVFLFPSVSRSLPGLHCNVVPTLSLTMQLIDTFEKATQLKPTQNTLELNTNFKESFTYLNRQATLYVAVFKQTSIKHPHSQWKTLPELLKQMPKTKIRSAYLKAWQVLSEETLA